MDMNAIGRLLLVAGLALVVLGGLVLLLGQFTGLDLGRLPGDFAWESESGRTKVFFPLATMIILSIVLTILVNVVLRLFR